jgi:L-threonylcarbamoyladenylate synthase
MDNPADVIEKLKKGEVGIFPTDTAFGIGCRMDNIESVGRVYELRNRPSEKALLALVSSIKMAEEYVTIPESVKKDLIEKYWPGGLTLVLECKKEKVPAVVRANGGTLAIRFPDHPVLVSIIEKVGVPIVAPSANFSGSPTPFSLDEVDTDLLSKVDFVLPGVCTIKGVSTIVDTTVEPWEMIREGVVKVYIRN